MINIFIGGSRKISRLNKVILKKLDNIIEKGNSILIGDANGADKAIQKYLFSKQYLNVTVFCVGNCRNNIGNWEIKLIEPTKKKRDFIYYSRKDNEMIGMAHQALLIWDGDSRGTLANLLNLLKYNREVNLYITKVKKFHKITKISELDDISYNANKGPLFTNDFINYQEEELPEVLQ